MNDKNTLNISVVIPIFNADKYLHRCINSVLSQSYTDFELLLIDDGSTDKSGKICDEYAREDDRVRVFHKENGGVSSARNLGLDNAKGEWVSFVDADDRVETDYLKKCTRNFAGFPKMLTKRTVYCIMAGNRGMKRTKAGGTGRKRNRNHYEDSITGKRKKDHRQP